MLEEIGRKKLFGHNLLVLGVSLETILHYWSAIGMDKAPAQVVRFILTIGLLMWIRSGSHVARVIGIILFWIGGFGMVSAAIKIYEVDFWWGLSIGANGLIYLFYARALIWSPEIKEFFKMQRAES